MAPSDEFAERHPSTTGILRFFAFEHLKPPQRGVSEACASLAVSMVRRTARS